MQSAANSSKQTAVVIIRRRRINLALSMLLTGGNYHRAQNDGDSVRAIIERVAS